MHPFKDCSAINPLFIIFAIAFALYLVIYQMGIRFVGPMSADEQRILEKKRSLEKQYGL